MQMMVARGLITRLLTGRPTEEMLLGIQKMLEVRGFKFKAGVGDLLGIADEHSVHFHPSPGVAQYFSEVRLHMDHFSGIELQAKPLVLGQASAAQKEAFKKLADEILHTIKHTM